MKREKFSIWGACAVVFNEEYNIEDKMTISFFTKKLEARGWAEISYPKKECRDYWSVHSFFGMLVKKEYVLKSFDKISDPTGRTKRGVHQYVKLKDYPWPRNYNRETKEFKDFTLRREISPFAPKENLITLTLEELDRRINNNAEAIVSVLYKRIVSDMSKIESLEKKCRNFEKENKQLKKVRDQAQERIEDLMEQLDNALRIKIRLEDNLQESQERFIAFTSKKSNHNESGNTEKLTKVLTGY